MRVMLEFIGNTVPKKKAKTSGNQTCKRDRQTDRVKEKRVNT